MSGREGLFPADKRLREKVNEYFDICAQDGVPPTPSGLALKLGVRTSDLDGEQLSEEQRRILGQAMQRIEANTMELMLTRGGVKGMESILEKVGESSAGRRRREIRRLTDEEIRLRLKRMMPGIRAAVEKSRGEEKGRTEE